MKNIRMKTILMAGVAYFLLLIPVFAQQAGSRPEMADAMHADGKIYVVVLVLLLILAGILFFLVLTDRKISKLEKRNH